MVYTVGLRGVVYSFGTSRLGQEVKVVPGMFTQLAGPDGGSFGHVNRSAD